MARRVDQIQAVAIAVFGVVMQANAFCFDGDAALALKIHGVEHLRGHFALRKAAGHFNQAIGKRGFAVVNVRNDAEISLELRVHVPVFAGQGGKGSRLPGIFSEIPRRKHRRTAQNRCLGTD